MVGNLLSFYNGCSDTQVVNTAIVAGTQECLIDADTADLFGRNYIIHKIRACCYRPDFRQVKRILSCVNRIRITPEYSLRLTSSCL